ncbi:MAG: N-acetylmuramoyl-L-alanine amidase [Melioribacteraceae bacterium]|nr:N-acetylmuramoyl-L-alanine amidase [Melioribacteraceae bacterium]
MKYLISTLFIGMLFLQSCKMCDCGSKSEIFDDLGINIISKSEWNALPVDELKMGKHEISLITIHHSGVEYDGKKSSKEKALGLQKFSINDKKWPDVPYHYMIDLDGNVLEGRNENFAGETNTTYNPSGHLLIEVMGNYEVQKLNNKQFNTLVKMCVYGCLKYNIQPDVIKGHKDYAETLCPGKDIYENYLVTNKIKNAVKEILENN